MEMERLLSRDEFTGLEQWFKSNDDATKIEIITKPIDDSLFAANHRDLQQHDEHARFGEMRLVARLPVNVYTELYQRGITQSKTAIRKWLNNSDNRVFRVFPRRV